MIKEKDCVSIDYNAYTKEDNRLFDTTNKSKAEEKGIFQKESKYEPVRLIVGKGLTVKGVDESLIGRKVGDSYKITVPAEKGFGKWNSKLTENIKFSSFRKQEINPVKDMIVNIGGRLCRVMLVIPGRFVKVDYNHPLAGKELLYEIKITGRTDKLVDKVETIAGFLIGESDVKVDGKNIRVKSREELPENAKKLVKNMIEDIVGKGYKVRLIK